MAVIILLFEALARHPHTAGQWDLCTVPKSAQVNTVNVGSLDFKARLKCGAKLIVQYGL